MNGILDCKKLINLSNNTTANKAKIIGYTRMMRRALRRNGLNDEIMKKDIEHYKERIIELVDKYNELVY